MAENIIELDNIDVTFQQKKRKIEAVKDVSLHVEKGDIYGVVGYSGAGKSTLVRVVNLLQKPSAGRVKVNGDVFYENLNGKETVIDSKKLREKRRKIGMIFQRFNLLNEQTAVENVEFALKHSNLKEKEITEKALKLLELVGLSERAKSYPAQLSGGEQQRVAIARALANDPEILISDEATSALDPKNTIQILDLLKDLNARLGVTIILITHEMDAVKRVANRVAVMEQGQIIEKGTLHEIFTQPKQQLTKEFVGGSLEAIATLKTYHLAKLQENEKIMQLIFTGATISEPITIKLYRDFNVEANIIYSNIEVLGATPVGTLFVIIKGIEKDRQAAIAFLKEKGIVVHQIGEEELSND
ncbi:methionine ABC transporter ATP-binding protein [Liquorilactobacillus satsumensis]|uniref:ABC superfamily ATP binding cassette transporter, binding protein n=1 Tax=Liquorilactobacillus satsumensis DSM 16230 = JCM 12392 TaxID=1423801 RepID=A0A0R1VER7_9LACO|nr:methionine ABC transporter ATP-binding protein [Liquorilactobacillus satsumensis]KRM00332.1 ABC superfamily ATP binding cassette transporter, binding protein [Liquorilactobacillus satsumensis DSM 16230 = JCM 12392]MCP9313669.1 methionine ABC transporter ATP-binding protein [Liquorilactobacillus satsumensis]MCP9328991.1 methionine ABC transporter ATP-binding protein [Liquorilactobacillus satsumensis]MCP9360810.1 methionine ABC transporter ATP-binding protein [Liquorilactobacillus satsumensis]